MWVSFRAPLKGLRSLQKDWARPSCSDRVPPKRPIGPGGHAGRQWMDRGAARCNATKPSERESHRAGDVGTPWDCRKGSRKRRRSLSTGSSVSHLTLFPHRVKGPQRAHLIQPVWGRGAIPLRPGPRRSGHWPAHCFQCWDQVDLTPKNRPPTNFP